MRNIISEFNKYICLDRDGTIIEHVHHLTEINQVEFIPDIFDGCKLLMKHGYKFGMFTNQSVVGRGKCTLDKVDEIHDLIRTRFASNGLYLEFVYTCPHLPEDGCNCRKPRIGMGIDAIKKYRIDFKESFMIGDSHSDIEFGQKLGMRTVQISKFPYTNATITESSFYNAARRILDLRRT